MSSIQKSDQSAPETEYHGEDIHDVAFANRGCCFWPTGSNWWERIRAVENEDRWWVRGWKKIREWSEVVAGPKWKTFIRRFNKNRANGYKQATFRYDPLSYALNFDDGHGQNSNLDDDYLRRDFSARYASIPASAKSSMDLGKDGPSFT